MTWTVRTALSVINIERGQEVVVSYLPLSHAAAQMFDMWMGIAYAVTTYFAQPDALKVKTPSAVSGRLLNEDSLTRWHHLLPKTSSFSRAL